MIRELEGTGKLLANPFIVFYPTVSQNLRPFPSNDYLKLYQTALETWTKRIKFDEWRSWRGDLVVAKYADDKFSSMAHAGIEDLPLVQNWLVRNYMYP